MLFLQYNLGNNIVIVVFDGCKHSYLRDYGSKKFVSKAREDSMEKGIVSLFAYGNTGLALANKEVDNISKNILLQSPRSYCQYHHPIKCIWKMYILESAIITSCIFFPVGTVIGYKTFRTFIFTDTF